MAAGTALGVLVALAAARAAIVAGRREPARRRLAPPGRLPPLEVGRRARAWWAARPAAHRRAVVRGLPAVLDEVARLLRSGASMRQALAGAAALRGPAAEGLRAAVGRAELGVPLADALTGWSVAEPLAPVRLAAAALGLAAEAGGQAARAVDAVAATLREQQAAAKEVSAHSVQARSSAAVIAVLPLVFTAWCLATDDRAAGFLLASPAGWVCLGAGLALLAAGAVWMARLVGAPS